MADDTRADMTGAGLRAWREAAGWTQAEAAKALGASRPTVARAESAPGEPISRKLAEAVAQLGGNAGMAEPPAAPIRKAATIEPPAKAQPAAKRAKAEGDKPLHLRTFGRTSAECRAIREAKALKADKDGRTVGVPLVPLMPEWVTVGRRIVNAAIPKPLDRTPPPWAGSRGVISADGAVYDYETAHRLTPFG